jgi:cell division protein FtsL
VSEFEKWFWTIAVVIILAIFLIIVWANVGQ